MISPRQTSAKYCEESYVTSQKLLSVVPLLLLAAVVAAAVPSPLDPVRIVVGENFRFGFRAAGDVETLAELGAGRFAVQGVPLVTDGSPSPTSAGPSILTTQYPPRNSDMALKNFSSPQFFDRLPLPGA